MSIPIDKLACGNCILRNDKGNCRIDGRAVPQDCLSCSYIHENFEDRGFTSPIKSEPLDWNKINVEATEKDAKEFTIKLSGEEYWNKLWNGKK